MIAVLPPARSFRTALKKDMKGHEIYALQLLLNDLFLGSTGVTLVADGDFGPATEARVIAFQKAMGLATDGIAGIKTQMTLCQRGIDKADSAARVPHGLLKGLMENESGYVVGSVNWSVAGGVDCGPVQHRVYVDSYQVEVAWKKAFGYGSILAAAQNFRSCYDSFKGRPGAKTDRRAWELAALNHNWPAGALQLAKGVPLSTADASWVRNIGVRGVTTPAQWAEFYISKATVYVKDFKV